MVATYRRGRKHQHRRAHSLQPLDLRLVDERRIIYPRVACAVAIWLRQQSARSSSRHK